MFKKPLFLPGVKDWEIPAALMNSGLTLWMAAAVLPDIPRINKATSPAVSNPSESPTKSMT
eukprot:CAMPEP_0198125866 /NCGR_PEP_ID=MMETSP1442-20131203/43548_1 /TAXON_ID= /ORGANISM="Craspedostauros australis, Strain CCMP3328" /LENGTH=60 /DNA_ID=CAMNT_0043785541 /DNA_START=35 /DNA_END=214 /DNA_ORIENTATION=+